MFITSLPPECERSIRAQWPNTFHFGDFVRLTYHPQLWGRIIGPGRYEGSWVLEYPGGARITNDADEFEPFEPSAAQRGKTDDRFAQLAVSS